MPTSAREEILARIRYATHPATHATSFHFRAPSIAASRAGWVPPTPYPAIDVAAEYSAIPRDYKRTSTIPQEAILHQLEDRLRDYDAHVYRTPPADLPAAIARTLQARGKTRIAIPTGTPPHWLTPGIAFLEDDRTNITQIDSCEGVLTTATLAIAETGTIVLQDVPGPNSGGQGRRALSLLPDYHLCILRADQVVQTVPEAIALLQPTAALATTFFSGPSATADIEMTRIKGVHGPRFVDVILVV